MARNRRLATLAVVGLVLLAGCAGGGLTGGGDASEQAAPDVESGGDGEMATATSAPAENGASRSQEDGVVRTKRALVYTGTVKLRVDDFDAARSEIAAMARERGGFVAGSDQQVHREDGRTWTSGRVVVRVPNEEFQATFADVKALGEVRSSHSEVRDVTDQLVDLEARLENLRAQRSRLRELYRNANDTEAALRIQKRLSEVQGHIERLKAQKRSLENKVAFSTITVRLTEPRPPTPTPSPTPTPPPAYHETSLYQAFAASVNGVVVTVQTVAVTLAYLAPYVLAFGLPVAGLAAVAWRRDLLG